MKKSLTKIIALLLAVAMLISLTACGNSHTGKGNIGDNDILLEGNKEEVSFEDITKDENGNTFISSKDENEKIDQKNEENITSDFNVTPKGEYNKGVALVKFKNKFDKTAFGELAYISAEQLYNGSKWYIVKLSDIENTEDAVNYLAKLGTFEKVDFDYVMGVTTEGKEKVTDNPNYSSQTNLGVHNIPYGWTQNGKHPGGSSDVVVAVIDTGVDYNHLDLRNNIWVNIAEIPNNKRDDDGNGYVDDVYGWDCVGNDNDPMDDNGHGTHVAGIVAAENNKIGGIGVAYNCKVMVIKAGNSSGYFNNSDIAEAIQYAYMNGASVINMSFGGSNISIAVEEALQEAYTNCVLVAAAGNSSLCNQLGCSDHGNAAAFYPAALPFVIGVMSTDVSGKNLSSFSNYDHTPYNNIEYEVYAVGEEVNSTWPNNKYASLNGTSMAAPTVAGIAALLRSYYTDREKYSTKYIQSQIVNTGTVYPYNAFTKETDRDHSVADVYEAMTRIPKPSVNLYEYYIDDNKAISNKNNGNGVIDAGETVRLYISLHNRGGVAREVSVSIDTLRNGEFTDPYFTFVNSIINISDIGTYSIRESADKFFEIIVSPECPNDYLVDFNIHYTYKNGLDENDNTVYKDDGTQKAQFNISSGYLLPSVISEDTVYKADKLYIVGNDIIIPANVTVTFEEGCEIQYYDDREYYNSPAITVYGTLNFSGTKKSAVKIHPNERHSTFACQIITQNDGRITMEYTEGVNVCLRAVGVFEGDYHATISNSCLKTNLSEAAGEQINCYSAGEVWYEPFFMVSAEVITNSTIYVCSNLFANKIDSSYIILKGNNEPNITLHNRPNEETFIAEFKNNIVYSTIEKYDLMSARFDFAPETVVNNNYFDSYNKTTLANIYQENYTNWSNNKFGELYQKWASGLITGYYDDKGNPTVDVYGSLRDASLLWPHIVNVEIFDKDGNAITTVGKEEIKVRVTFNRPMDTTKDTFITFGTIKPYADYKITGEYISDTVWEGTYTLKAQIENGQNFLKVNNACAAEGQIKTVFGEYQLHEFTIDTTVAMSMNLLAMAKNEGVELTFAQDDYDTLLGYNVYRSTEKDGNYVKLNPTIILPEENYFLDVNAEPGKSYWYTYTVVLSDFTESNPAGKVQATAKDTMAPSLYHTPVNQGYENNNLVISCTASDNIGIEKVTLFYRTVGASEWKKLQMVKQNDKYSATIFGSDVTLAGLEYYIVAEDRNNTVNRGTAETPYVIVIKTADSISRIGDVDGNGTVNTKDALMLMQCLSGDLLLTDDAFKRADLNGDNVLSSAEALRILQYVNGKVNSLEM